MKTSRLATYAALLSVASPAIAAPKWAVQPIQTGQESVRYFKDTPTVDLELNDGVVQVTPLPLDHGRLSFGIAVYNDSHQPANLGIEHVAPTFDGRPVRVFTKSELVKQAKNRAMWGQIGLAFLGSLASATAASQRSYYRSSFVTPRGTYRSYFSAPSLAGQYQAATISAGTGVGIALIQTQLDRTIATLGDQVVQLTTVDPGESYAGFVVLDKIKPQALPSQVQIVVNWNGERYPFTFQIAKKGTSAPAFMTLTRKSDFIDFQAVQPPAPGQAAIRGTIAGAPIDSTLVQPMPGPVRQASVAVAAQLPGQPDAAGRRRNPAFGNSHVRCETCR